MSASFSRPTLLALSPCYLQSAMFCWPQHEISERDMLLHDLGRKLPGRQKKTPKVMCKASLKKPNILSDSWEPRGQGRSGERAFGKAESCIRGTQKAAISRGSNAPSYSICGRVCCPHWINQLAQNPHKMTGRKASHLTTLTLIQVHMQSIYFTTLKIYNVFTNQTIRLILKTKWRTFILFCFFNCYTVNQPSVKWSVFVYFSQLIRNDYNIENWFVKHCTWRYCLTLLRGVHRYKM